MIAETVHPYELLIDGIILQSCLLEKTYKLTNLKMEEDYSVHS